MARTSLITLLVFVALVLTAQASAIVLHPDPPGGCSYPVIWHGGKCVVYTPPPPPTQPI